MSDVSIKEGHCLCGAVTFSISAQPVMAAQCHCEHCRRSSGQGHMSQAFFRESDLTVNGETSSYTADTDTGSQVTRSFCPTCGSRMFGRNTARPGLVGISIGVFNEVSWFQPDRIVYNKAKPDWDYMDPAVPVFDEMPPVTG